MTHPRTLLSPTVVVSASSFATPASTVSTQTFATPASAKSFSKTDSTISISYNLDKKHTGAVSPSMIDVQLTDEKGSSPDVKSVPKSSPPSEPKSSPQVIPKPSPQSEIRKIPFGDLKENERLRSLKRYATAEVSEAEWGDQKVSLKKFQYTPKARRAFKRELEAMKALSFPSSIYIAKSLGFCPEVSNCCSPKSPPALVMEPMGEVLTSALKSGKLSLAQRVKVAFEIASALYYLHGDTMIHGDIRSDNVLLYPNPNNAANIEAKLANFASTSKSGKLASGSPIWAAPELFDAKVLPEVRNNTKTDIYSFGVLLFELVQDNYSYFEENFVKKYSRPLDQKELTRRKRTVFDEEFTTKIKDLNHRKWSFFEDDIIKPLEELQKKSKCPQQLVKLITDCVQLDDKGRPTIKKILTELIKILALKELFPAPPPTIQSVLEDSKKAKTCTSSMFGQSQHTGPFPVVLEPEDPTKMKAKRRIANLDL